MNLNIPPIYRIEFVRYGSPPGKIFSGEKKTITDPLLLAKIRKLLNSEVEDAGYYEEPPEGEPTHFLRMFTEHSIEPLVFEFKAGGALINQENVYLYFEIQYELWEVFEKEMFGHVVWSPT